MKDWVEAAGKHCQKVHQARVLQPRDLGQVQADEILGKIQGGILWLAMAIMVSTRLWLGGVIGATRDTGLIAALVAFIRACPAPSPLLLVTDGLSAYGGDHLCRPYSWCRWAKRSACRHASLPFAYRRR